MATFSSLYDDALQKFCSDMRDDHRVKKGDEAGEKQLLDFLASRGTAQQAKESALMLQNDAGRKYSAKKHGEKEVVPKKWIDNIMGNIGNAIDVGDKLLKFAPESVSIAWFCVKLGLNAIQSNYELYSLFGSGLTSMTEIMILIPHYDQLYDERNRHGSEPNELIEMLFRDVTAVYVAVLDFLFSVKRHIEASPTGKFRHALRDLVGGEVSKYQAKQDNIAVLKAKVLEDSEGAFQQRVFDSLGSVQNSLKKSVDDIHMFASTAKELAQVQSDILSSIQDLKVSMKRRSRLDWAKQDFDDNKKALDPLPCDTRVLSEFRAKMHPETIKWVLEADKFINWKASEQSTMLCLLGQKDVGKSVVLASAFETLKNTNQDNSMICFLSCIRGDKQDELGARPLERITRSLIFQVYKLAVEDESKPEILEECNKLFDRSKANKKQQLMTDNADDGLPRFGDAIFKLAAIMDRNVFFVVDAVDRLSHNDQCGLFDAFRDIMTRSSTTREKIVVRVLATCRTGEAFANRASESDLSIDIEEGNRKDMALHLSCAIEDLVDWTTEERTKAEEKVLTMAGTRFGYLSEVAIPFLRQPFQRPIVKRLEQLPQGIMDSYKQEIERMAPNYLDLLRTALTWTLYSAQPVRVKEVVEAYSGVYDAGRDGDVPDDYDSESGYKATDLELQQIRDIGGPFLKVTKNMCKEHIVSLRDYAQIQKFCDQPVQESDDIDAFDTHKHCTRCGVNLDSTHPLGLTERQVHLDLALQLVQHLNNPLFQKRFGLLRRQDSSGDEQALVGLTEQERGQLDDHSQQFSNGTRSVKSSLNEDADQDHDSNTLETSHETEATPTVIAEIFTDDESNDGEGGDDHDTDDSSEDEDRAEIDINRKLKALTNVDDKEDSYDGSYNGRYEIFQWAYHARKADKMWPCKDKAGNPKWAQLIVELDRFAFGNKRVFESWQWITGAIDGYLEKQVDALHAAACLGLAFWVEHLTKDLGQDPRELSKGRNALQAAALCPDNNEVLSLFLDYPGIDATLRGTSSPIKELTALQEILLNDPTQETVKLFADSGADFNKLYEETADSALHFFAAGSAIDSASLDLILASGGTNEQARPNINAENNLGNTPLHFLMLRRDVPLDLLRAFIAKGANVNAENKSSLRPLQSACSWSEPELVEILLSEVSDIDDPDDVGQTALHTAAMEGSAACVKLLLEHHANINCKEKHGRSPLHFAARNGHVDTIKELIEWGAELNIGDVHDRTPFWCACNSDSKESAAALLAALKPKISIAEINQPSKSQRTPLRLAAAHGFSEIVQELCSMTATAGLDLEGMLNIQDTKKRYTALHRAASRGEPDCVRILLEHGANPALRDTQGNTALMLATTRWKLYGAAFYGDIVLLLIDKDREQAKIDPELPATAATNGNIPVLEKLSRIGANVNKADSFGWTPLMLAQRLQNTNVEDFLKKQIAWVGALPSAWVHHDAATAATVELSDDGVRIRYTAATKCCVCTDKPLPAGLDCFYYEVTSHAFLGEEGQSTYPIMALGFCTFGAQSYQFPGWPPKYTMQSGQSWAYHGDDGFICAGTFDRPRFGEKYGPGDTVGCGVNLETQKIWFTKNGKKLDFEHHGVRGRLFAIIGLEDSVSLETNFGGRKPFKWSEANVDS